MEEEPHGASEITGHDFSVLLGDGGSPPIQGCISFFWIT
jgi:hypothetical protein